MDALRRRLMLQESESRLEAAKALRGAGDTSDSAYLLELLGFELLLKLLVEEHTGQPAPRHHHYEKISITPDSWRIIPKAEAALRSSDGPAVVR